MKTLIITFALLLICNISNGQKKDSLTNPCKDVLYLQLKKKPLDSLSQREYEYYIEKEKSCSEYNKAVMQNKPSEKMANQYESNSKIWLYILGAGALLSIVSYIIYASQIK